MIGITSLKIPRYHVVSGPSFRHVAFVGHAFLLPQVSMVGGHPRGSFLERTLMKKTVKRSTAKIELRRETIRRLSETDLQGVQGGVLTSSLGTLCLTLCKACA